MHALAAPQVLTLQLPGWPELCLQAGAAGQRAVRSAGDCPSPFLADKHLMSRSSALLAAQVARVAFLQHGLTCEGHEFGPSVLIRPTASTHIKAEANSGKEHLLPQR